MLSALESKGRGLAGTRRRQPEHPDVFYVVTP